MRLLLRVGVRCRDCQGLQDTSAWTHEYTGKAAACRGMPGAPRETVVRIMLPPVGYMMSSRAFQLWLLGRAGMQVLAGDIDLAQEAFAAFLSLWRRFGLLPERFLLDNAGGSIHPLEQYYPLRPELMESAFYLYQVQDIFPLRHKLCVKSHCCCLMHNYLAVGRWPVHGAF